MPVNLTGKTEAKFNRAMECHRNGEQALAKKLYRSVLKTHPDHAGALHLLGLLSYQLGDGEAALRLMRSAIRQQPDHLDALNNLGNVLLERRKFAEAEECYRKVLVLKPEFAAAYSNLCVIFRKQNRLPEAIEAGRTAVNIDPQHPIAWHNLGNCYDKFEKYAKAIECYDKAIQTDPGLLVAHDAFCRLTLQEESKTFFGRKKRKKTIRAYERWLECIPDTPLAKFMLQAIRGEDAVTRMPDAVVRGMFDTFAPHFEKSLGNLEYRVPGLIAPALQVLLGAPKKDLQGLDAGCGTGLCGPAIRLYAVSLTGVDLSPLMLKKARESAVYDELVEAELGAYLKQNPATYDIKGRYFHSVEYVKRVLTQAGFTNIDMQNEVLRQEFSNPVAGLLVSARME